MEQLLKELLEEQKKTNELLSYGYRGKDPNELLTANQVAEEYEMNSQTAQALFRDKKLQVQRWTKPYKVKRRVLDEYFEVNHDYLKGGR